MFTGSHAAGMIVSLLLVVGVSLYSMKRVASSADFNSGNGKAKGGLVAGIITGTLVGGSSTVGTAQLAYNSGLSAIWFALGGSLGCLILALVFCKPIRASHEMTIAGVIGAEYGEKAAVASSVLTSVGMFINILSQLIAATAVFSIVAPNMPLIAQFMLAAALMMVYVIFGGVIGTGMIGMLKLLLLYIAVVASAAIVLSSKGGFGALWHNLDHRQYFNILSRGAGIDLGSCASMVLGVLSTQSYVQAMLAGRSDRESQRGALLSAALMPPIGMGGILVGLYMRVNYPLTPAKMVFPQFVLDNFPPLFAGIILGTLVIAILGTGAGLSLGISTALNRDLIKRYIRKNMTDKASLLCSRVIIMIVLSVACVCCIAPIGDAILGFAFMSMGLRGAVAFVPFICALWLKGRVRSGYILLAMIVSPFIILCMKAYTQVAFDPLFIGVAAAALICFAGRKKRSIDPVSRSGQ